MKKIYIIILLLIMSFNPEISLAEPPHPYGWSSRLESRWETLKSQNHPLWQKANGVIKYLTDEDPRHYVFGDTTVKFSIGWWCGKRPYEVHVKHVENKFIVVSSSASYGNWQPALSNGLQIKIRAKKFPAGIDPATTYFMVNVTDDHFQLSLTQGGSVVPVGDNGEEVSWVTLDDVFYYPEGCRTMTNGSLFRAQGPQYMKQYLQVKDILTPQQDAIYLDILDAWIHTVMIGKDPVRGFNGSDSDEVVSHVNSFILYYFILKEKNPKRAQEALDFVGGLTPTSVDQFSSMRNAVAHYGSVVDAMWIESSEYNPGNLRATFKFVYELADWLGVDYFPEITELYPRFKEGIMHIMHPAVGLVESPERNPDGAYSQFTWGDVQDAGLRAYYKVDYLHILAHILNDDPDLLYLADRVEASYPFRIVSSEYANPNGIRTRESEWNAKAGSTLHDEKRGMVFKKYGWDKNATAFYSAFYQSGGVDHGMGTSNFVMVRNAHQVINYPQGYYVGQDYNVHNNLQVFGSQISGAHQGVIYFDEEKDWMFHVQAGSGVPRNGFPNGSGESVHEHSEYRWQKHYKNGDDVLILYNRLHTRDPREAGSYTRYSTWQRDPMEVAALGDESNAFKDRWRISIPTENPTIETDKWIWSLGADKILFQSFDSGKYIFRIVDEAETYKNKSEPRLMGTPAANGSQWQYQLKLLYNQKFGYKTVLNAFHIGQNNMSFDHGEVKDKTKDDLRYLTIASEDETDILVFNQEQGAKIPLQQRWKSNDCYNYENPIRTTGATNNCKLGYEPDPTRLEKVKQKQSFKTGGSFTVNTNAAATLFLFALDPARSWSVTINGNTSRLEVGKNGVTKVAIPENKNNHSIVFESTSTCDALDWRDCADQLKCESNAWYWNQSSVCVQYASCDSQNLDLCKTRATCESEGVGSPGYWDANSLTCESAPAGIGCGIAPACGKCSTQRACEATKTCYYYGGMCENQAPSTGGLGDYNIVPTADATIQKNNPTVNYGDTSGLGLIDGPGAVNDRSILLKFAIPAELKDQTISDVKLSFYQTQGGGMPVKNYAYELLQHKWSESEATWNSYDGKNPWSTVGARANDVDFIGDRTHAKKYLAVVDNSQAVNNQRIYFQSDESLKLLVEANVGGFINIVIHQKAYNNKIVWYSSKEAKNPEQYPLLEVTVNN